MTQPWILTPHSRQTIRTEGETVEIIVGGPFDIWTDIITIDEMRILILSSERITNTSGGRAPMRRIVAGEVGFGEHVIQLNDQQPMKFYTNPLY